ncbi:MAG TPA: PLP-dependent lyase/thiolase [Candidatus Woesebacteria bacterium]|nr:PLP-dependent lyase/thiolase [Candidatus Woesebacteria bacterium]
MTPLIPIDQIYFKREDLNPTGSAKDRVIPLIIKYISQNHFSEAVISSTGNAAISAQYFCQKANIKLTVFVSPKTSLSKLKLITNPVITPRPISDAFKYAKRTQAYFIRLSTDPQTLTGYRQIGQEITAQLPQTTSVFVPTGSGATALGIRQSLPRQTKLFIVQPAGYCPLASNFDHNFTPESQVLTDALRGRYLPLKKKVLDIIKAGIVVQNWELIEAQKYLQKHLLRTSPEGALALAGYFKQHHQAGQFPVILLTGTQR